MIRITSFRSDCAHRFRSGLGEAPNRTGRRKSLPERPSGSDSSRHKEPDRHLLGPDREQTCCLLPLLLSVDAGSCRHSSELCGSIFSMRQRVEDEYRPWGSVDARGRLISWAETASSDEEDDLEDEVTRVGIRRHYRPSNLHRGVILLCLLTSITFLLSSPSEPPIPDPIPLPLLATHANPLLSYAQASPTAWMYRPPQRSHPGVSLTLALVGGGVLVVWRHYTRRRELRSY